MVKINPIFIFFVKKRFSAVRLKSLANIRKLNFIKIIEFFYKQNSCFRRCNIGFDVLSISRDVANWTIFFWQHLD